MKEEKISGKMAFKPEEVADGKMDRFIKVLIENNCEIRLWTDRYCYVVEYLEDVETADGRHFEAVDEEEVVVDGKYVNWEQYDADGKNK